ncbi:hypothetical protein AA099_09940 [Xanthomonas citri pv. citri]|uniref:hypothetical protein n=1 Tax=Xanthomonas citri TaxID=346 RepID=UPI000C1568B0|nr:hypothetical protein [Xanthomonas citri]PIB21451.1 hypothetical protein AA099_09940 [Xanthomonas citri pv. citri]
MRAYRGAAALAAIALAGCASTQGPSSVPTNLKNGQSWIITRQSVAEQVLQTCSRDSPARHPGRISGAREAIQVCDGGSMFWGALYEPQTGAFSQIAINGSP